MEEHEINRYGDERRGGPEEEDELRECDACSGSGYWVSPAAYFRGERCSGPCGACGGSGFEL